MKQFTVRDLLVATAIAGVGMLLLTALNRLLSDTPSAVLIVALQMLGGFLAGAATKRPWWLGAIFGILCVALFYLVVLGLC